MSHSLLHNLLRLLKRRLHSFGVRDFEVPSLTLVVLRPLGNRLLYLTDSGPFDASGDALIFACMHDHTDHPQSNCEGTLHKEQFKA